MVEVFKKGKVRVHVTVDGDKGRHRTKPPTMKNLSAEAGAVAGKGILAAFGLLFTGLFKGVGLFFKFMMRGSPMSILLKWIVFIAVCGMLLGAEGNSLKGDQALNVAGILLLCWLLLAGMGNYLDKVDKKERAREERTRR